MTFFIPPVFLFGNNTNRFHNEEEKPEYKTAAETEIKVENWRVKRIAELEKENKKLKEMNGKLGEMNGKLGKWVNNLEEENKKLKERVSELEDVSKDYDLLSKDFIALGEENKKLKENVEKLKVWVYKNIEGDKRKDYQEFCRENNL